MIGTKLAHYEITSHLGTGGMGEVYQATDSKLGRGVAIKLLPEAFTHDHDRVARFEREARVLASLNHPNIAAIYGIEESGGRKFLVMELVPGETLAARMNRGAIPVDEALGIAKEIAEGLDAAHEKGIIHRDLKPANVKLAPDGKVKILDFGLAKAFEPEIASASLSNSPTLSFAATQAGVILGTAAYMSPEQARGKSVDKRTDIWAFGVVLHQMLTGKQLFHGTDVSEILAGVLRQEIDFNHVPPKLRPLLKRCLDRDPRKRLRDIGEARVLLDESGVPLQTEVPAKFPRMWGAASAILLIALSVLAFVHFRETPQQQVSLRFQVQPLAKGEFLTPALSPNGRLVAFASNGKLWIHSFDTLESHSIAGTDGGASPFWSPDSENIGFFADGNLKRIAVAGGPAQFLAPAPNGIAGAWNQQDIILFNPTVPSPLFQVPANSGMPVQVTKVEGNDIHLLPSFLPDGEHFLYLVFGAKDRSGIVVGSLHGAAPVHLLPDPVNAIFNEGHILFRRGETLMARLFDVGRLQFTGDAFHVAEHVSGNLGYGAFTLSETGILAYVGGSSIGTVQLAWKDRTGKPLELFGPPGPYQHFRLAPDDEKRIVYDTNGAGKIDLWGLDSVRGIPYPLTFDPELDNIPLWSPDGLKVVWPSNRSGNFDLYIKAANGTGQEKLLVKMGTVTGWATDWSKDGSYILYQRPGDKTGQDLWIAPQSADGKDDVKAGPYLNGQFDEQDGRFSPDGKWVAYTSNESGVPEIYVQSFPLSNVKFPISTGGGSEPQWSPDGTELFYLRADLTLIAVSIRHTPSEPMKPGQSTPLFRVPPVLVTGPTARSYAVSKDGKRFLTASENAEASQPLTVVVNWKNGIKK